jgi:hypothetical protein
MQKQGFKTSEEQAWFDAEPACEAPSDGRPGRKPPIFYIAVACSVVSSIALLIMATIVLNSRPAQASQVAAPAALVAEAENVGAEVPAAHIVAAAAEPAPMEIVIEPPVVAETARESAPTAPTAKSSAATPVKKRVRTARPGATPVRSAKAARPEASPPARAVAPAAPAAPTHRYGHF